MQPRIEYDKAASDGVKAMSGLESYVHSCGLEPVLLALVKLRASQINGVPTASTCTPRRSVPAAKPSSGCTR